MSSDLPSPYDFLDYRAFVKAWFDAKKAQNPRFSHRVFCRMAGLRSSSLLSHVIQGERNLTARTTDGFVSAMKLRSGESAFFRLLVALDQADSDAERNEVWHAIRSTRRFREARRIDAQAFEYLSNWYYPAIRELVAVEGFRGDPAWIAERLSPPIRASEAREALDALEALALVERHGDAYSRAEASVATPTEIWGLAAKNYHREMIARAGESIDRFPGSERHLLAVTVSIPEGLLPELKAQANALVERLMDACDSADGPSARVVQINLQLFPLSSASKGDS